LEIAEVDLLTIHWAKRSTGQRPGTFGHLIKISARTVLGLVVFRVFAIKVPAS